MNRIVMEIDREPYLDWFSSQLAATCNVEQSFFNDWLSGHLSFQIEHHLFPTMPWHNMHKTAPLVRSLCAKHGIEYQEKPPLRALQDVIGSLRKSGQLWLDAYLHKPSGPPWGQWWGEQVGVAAEGEGGVLFRGASGGCGAWLTDFRLGLSSSCLVSRLSHLPLTPSLLGPAQSAHLHPLSLSICQTGRAQVRPMSPLQPGLQATHHPLFLPHRLFRSAGLGLSQQVGQLCDPASRPHPLGQLPTLYPSVG